MFVKINEKVTVNTDQVVSVEVKPSGALWVITTNADNFVVAKDKEDELNAALEAENKLRTAALPATASKKRGGTTNAAKNDK